jgi:hypothetical protein
MIGRVASAALSLDDPRVSEAHALLSLRRGELYLLSLRRLIGVRGKPVSEVRLVAGLEVELAPGVVLTVTEVTTSATVLGVRGDGLGTRPLGQVGSFLAGPPLRLVGRFVPEAVAHVWSQGPELWRLACGGAPPRAIAQGDRFVVAGVEVEVCVVDLEAVENPPTARGHDAPLRIVAHYDSVEIHRVDAPVVTIGGIGARMISELVTYAGPVSWEALARELWSDTTDAFELRHRWDVTLSRVRSRLREAGIRTDLLRSDGVGQIQLVLAHGDQAFDRT